jgi:hypothetical protein
MARADLTSTERLLGYETLIDAVIDDLGPTATTACVRSSRSTSSGSVPSVLVVLEDLLVEYWLSGTAVEWAEVRRPGRD